MQFPHLSDTQFPDLPTVNVYQFQNNFDYSRWNEKTKIKLCNVIWNSDYTDVVKWDTNEERDEWFDSLLDFWTVELRTAARIVPEGYVKLPIPYDVMARYNYLFVDMPVATSADNPIDYENSEGIRRWYFFVNNIQYLAPNATQVYVVPDIWTNFQNDVDITYMLLERGHAPVAASNTAQYLQDPISNNRYLLAPDVNFDNASITRSSSFVPFGNGSKYVCFATTCSPNLIGTLGSVTDDPSYDPTGNITYSDDPARYGYQLIVNGYGMGNGRNYANANTPAAVGFSDGLIANNLAVYAIAAEECYGNGTFFADVLHYCPQFLTTVQACFVVDEACITLGTSYVIAGHAVRKCVGKESTLLQKALTIADFGYPQELQRFAKLYTAPYAQLEITDNDGTTYEVNIEETTTLSVKSVVSIAFPYINERVYVDGIGGKGSQSYTWTDLRGQIASLGMQNSDWFKYCFDWQIPTFALFMDGQTAFMLESFNRNVRQGIDNALVAYHNSMRSANTAYENVLEQADVAYANTIRNAENARDCSYASADTGKTNADNLADTAHTNAYRIAATNRLNTGNSAATEKTNAYNAADANHTNAYNSADLAYNNIDRNCTAQSTNLVTANAAISTNEEEAMLLATYITDRSKDLADTVKAISNAMVTSTTDATIQKSTATAINGAIGTIVTSAINGATSGAMFGATLGGEAGTVTVPVVGAVPGIMAGAVAGAVIGGGGGGVSAAVSLVNNGVTTNTSATIAQAQQDANDDNTSNSNSTATLITNAQNQQKRDVYTTNATSTTTQMSVSNAASRANASDARTTQKTNADTTQTTTKTNADNTKNTSDTNAANTESAAQTVADNSQTTAKTNATNTKNTSYANAAATCETTRVSAGATRNNVKSNAGFTRQVAELNAKEILENAKNAGMAAIDDSRNSAPTEVCPYSGNPQADYMRTRGVQIKVKTQSDSAIRQTGDVFARFGYALNQVWNVAQSGLKLMNHFTYWKATELWVDDTESSNNAVNNFIHRMFLNGVTVWNDPTEIGRVNVYDN